MLLDKPMEGWNALIRELVRRLDGKPRQAAYGARANHDDWTLGVSRKVESGSTDMDGCFIDRVFMISTSGTLDSIGREYGLCTSADKCRSLTIGGIFEVEKEIGTNAKNSARWYPRACRLIFEHDTGDMDWVGVKLRARRDRVVPRLEMRNWRDNHVKGNLLWSGIFGSGSYFDVISSSELKKFIKFKAALVTMAWYSSLWVLRFWRYVSASGVGPNLA
jgi:hypothetical protein